MVKGISKTKLYITNALGIVKTPTVELLSYLIFFVDSNNAKTIIICTTFITICYEASYDSKNVDLHKIITLSP